MKTNLFNDYYEDLQVSPNADLETVERIYRLLAKRYHTDNPVSGNAEKFEAITRAFRIISNFDFVSALHRPTQQPDRIFKSGRGRWKSCWAGRKKRLSSTFGTSSKRAGSNALTQADTPLPFWGSMS